MSKKTRTEDIQSTAIIRNYSIADFRTQLSVIDNKSAFDRENIFGPALITRKYSYYSEKGSEIDKISTSTSRILGHFSKSHAQKQTVMQERKNEMIWKITNDRKLAVKMIIRNFRKYFLNLKIRKEKFIDKILNERQEKIRLIQKNYRMFFVRKHINEIRHGSDYVFFYNYIKKCESSSSSSVIQDKIYFKTENILLSSHDNSKNSNFNVNKNITHHCFNNFSNNQNTCISEIKLKFGKNDREFIFQYSRILNIHYLSFNKIGIMRKRFKVNFIVDGTTIIDPRFEVDNDNTGHFYNLIESSMFKKREVIKNSSDLGKQNYNINRKNWVHKKFWENIFEIKRNSLKDGSSVSDISEASEFVIEKLMSNNLNIKHAGQNHKKGKKQIKSILKRGKSIGFIEETISNISDKENNLNFINTSNFKNRNYPPNKKVSFSDVVHYSY